MKAGEIDNFLASYPLGLLYKGITSLSFLFKFLPVSLRFLSFPTRWRAVTL